MPATSSRGPRAAELGAEDAPAVVGEQARVDRDVGARRRHAHDHEGAAGSQQPEASLDGARRADGGEHEVGAGLGRLGDDALELVAARVDGMGRTEAACDVELLRRRVRGDDRLRTGARGGLHDVEPDAARADHHDPVSGRNARAVLDGADARHDRAGDDRRRGEADALGDGDDLRRMDDDLLRERAAADALPCAPAVGEADRARLVEPEGGGAQGRLAGAAAGAPAAVAHEADDDPVAGPHAVDAGPDLLDDPRGLVPEHDRHLAAPRAVEGRDVTVADGARADGHAHLVLLRRDRARPPRWRAVPRRRGRPRRASSPRSVPSPSPSRPAGRPGPSGAGA